LHPIVPNPYALLGLVPAEAKFFTCLELKDTFFCILLAPQSQPIFAFQWGNPNTRDKGQLTWTWSPQGFKNSPTIFGTVLASNLKAFSTNQHDCTLLQHVDDFLLAGLTWEDCMEGTHLLLCLLWEAGYKDTRSLEKRPKFAKTLSNTSAFICPRGNAGLALRENRLYVPFQPLRPAGKLEFWGAAGFC
jgi:hypothetical protein